MTSQASRSRMDEMMTISYFRASWIKWQNLLIWLCSSDVNQIVNMICTLKYVIKVCCYPLLILLYISDILHKNNVLLVLQFTILISYKVTKFRQQTNCETCSLPCTLKYMCLSLLSQYFYNILNAKQIYWGTFKLVRHTFWILFWSPTPCPFRVMCDIHFSVKNSKAEQI